MVSESTLYVVLWVRTSGQRHYSYIGYDRAKALEIEKALQGNVSQWQVSFYEIREEVRHGK